VAGPTAPLTILHALAPARFGGLERVVQSLAAGQLARGHRMHIAGVLGSEEEPPAFLADLERRGANVHLIAVPPRAYLAERNRVRELCRRLRPDVVHTHGYRPDVVAGSAARALGIPTVTTVHGFIGGGRRNRFYEWLQRRALRRFDAVVAVSRPLVERLEHSGIAPGRLHLVRNALANGTPLPSRRAARAALHVPVGAFHIGWVGRLSAEKGPDLMVEALAHLRDLPLLLAMIGDGRDGPALRRRAAELGVDDVTRWHGVVDSAARLFPAFDVFVLSSRTEGTPIALLEAVAAGVPVVATAVGGVPDVVSPLEALLVPPGDPTALAAAIRAVYTDRVAALERARAAAGRLRRELDFDSWISRYDAVYDRLVHRSKGSTR